MKKYPTYKPSGVEWLGEIPNDWEVWKMKFLTKIKTGDKNTEDAEDDGAYPFYVRSDNVERISSYSFEGEAILTAGDGVGVAKVYHYANGKMAIHQRVYKISHFKRVLGEFLYFYIKDNFEKEVIKLSAKTTVDSLRMPMLGNFPVIYPIIHEQENIIRFLNYKTAQIDNFIVNRQKQIELLKEQKEGIINKAVTKGLNPNAKMKASGIEWIGDIPEHWLVGKVRRVLSVLTDFTANGSFADLAKNVNYLDTPDYSRLIRLTDLREDLRNEGIYVNKHAHEFLSKSELFGGEILMANVGAYAGFVCLVPEINFIATLGPNMILLKFDKKKISNQYAYTLLSSNCYYKLLMNKALSSAQPKLNKEDVKSIDLIFPPTVEEQNKIIEYIKQETSTIDTLISKYQKQIDLMQEYRTSLISQAVTGKIDVRDWTPKK